MNIAKAVFDQLRQQESKTAFHAPNRSWTFLEVENAARRIANGLKSLGVARNNRVVSVTRNHAESLLLLLAAAKIGAVFTPLNFRLSRSELCSTIFDAEAKFVLLDREFVLTNTFNIPSVMAEDFLAWSAGLDVCSEEMISSDDNVVLQLYSSGTTGTPKGVLLTHSNLLSNFGVFSGYAGFTEKSIVLNALPTCHIAGMSLALNAIMAGGQSIFQSKFEPRDVLKAIDQFKVTHLFLVPTMLKALLDDAKSSQYNLSSLERIVYGGSPIEAKLLCEAKKVFDCGFIQTYGMTETTAGVTFLMPDDHKMDGLGSSFLRSAGKPLFGGKIKIIDTSSFLECKEEENGEIWIHSEKNMKGYWKARQATSEVFPEGREDGIGWLRTGDRGYLKEGYLFVTGRVKDLIISGGENIYPLEVENILLSHDGVLEAAVLGVPSERWGESVKAFVVPKNDAVCIEDLIAYTRKHLSHYKCPKAIELVKALPKTASGKVSKDVLRRKG